MKQNFYVFLDIDGVLNDKNYLENYLDNHPEEKGGVITRFNPMSMFALNYLIEKLEKDYNVCLVISSTWRSNMVETVKTLKNQNLKYNKQIDALGFYFNSNQRGKEILKYLENKNDKTNFVIIDDEDFDYKNNISKNKIIKTNFFDNSLNLKQVINFLKNMQNKDKILE